MKRVLSLVLVLVLVLGSFPVFADEAEATYGEMLAELELVLGDGDGNLMEGDALTRAQMMVVLARMYGVEEEAAAFVLPSTFTDVDADSYYAPYIAYAQMEGWTEGYGDGTFGPDDTLTADQAATFLLRVLGYSSEGDFAWDEAVEFAATLGIDVEAGVADDGSILRGELFEMMYKTLYTENTEGVLLAVVLELEEAAPEALEVVSVKALNLVQIEVVFNMEIEEETGSFVVEDLDDVDVKDTVLQDDGKTVILYVDKAGQQAEATVVIEEVQALDNEDMVVADTEMDVQFLDMDIPVVTGAENVGNDTFRVYFSESMDDYTDKAYYEVNDGAKYIKEVKPGTNGLSVDIVMYSKLEDGEYTVAVEDVMDFADFKALPKTFTVDVTEDTEAPYVVGYKDAEPDQVTLIWNEDIEFAVGTSTAALNVFDDDGDAYVYHTNNSNDATTAEITDNEMVLTFSDDYLLPEGTAYVYVANEVVNDLWDLENNQQMVQVDVSIDDAPPVVDDVEVEDYVLTITFNEDIDLDDEEFTFLDADGDEVSVNLITTGINLDDKPETLQFDVSGLDGEYTLVMEGVTDDAEPTANEMPVTTIEFVVEDETQPKHTDFSAVIYNAGVKDQMIKVDFDEAMATEGVYAVTNLENYVIKANIISGSTVDYELSEIADAVSINVVDGGEAVEIWIELEDDSEDGLDLVDLGTSTAAGITVGRVADLEGNYTEDYGADIEVSNQGTVGFGTVEATAVDTIEVTFDDELANIVSEDFQLLVSGTTIGVIADIDTELNDDDQTVLIFTLVDAYELNQDGTGPDDEAVTFSVIGTADSENIYGEKVAPGEKAADDKIAPALLVIDGGDYDEEDKVYVDAATGTVITLYFGEDILKASVSLNTFEVGGGDYEVLTAEAINATNATIVLTVDNAGNDDLVGVSVDQISGIRDGKGNVTTGISTEVTSVKP